MRIILVGYMAAGKTTLGRALGKAFNMPFYDLDWYISSRRHRNCEELFTEIGEEAFRRIEYNMLHEVAEFENVVISCGGGTPCFFDNMEYMNQQGETFYLKAPIDVIINHLKMARVQRPLLAGKHDEDLRHFISQHLQQREPFYMKAKHTIDVSTLDSHKRIQETINTIISLLQNP